MAFSDDGLSTTVTSSDRTAASMSRGSESPNTVFTEVAIPEVPEKPLDIEGHDVQHHRPGSRSTRASRPVHVDLPRDHVNGSRRSTSFDEDHTITIPQTNNEHFQSLEVHHSQAEWRNQTSVSEEPTPTRESVLEPSPHTVKVGEEGKKRRKLTVSPESLDRLLNALVHAPLLQLHVRRQWWDENPSVMSMQTALPETISTESDGASIATMSSKSSLYSQPYDQARTEQRNPSIAHAVLEQGFARTFPEHKPLKSAAIVPGVKFGGVAVIDPKVHGSPIRFVTRGYQMGPRVVQAGQCSFVKIAYGTSVDSNLHIEPSSNLNPTCRITLQVVNQVVDRKTGRRNHLLAAEVDVTDSFAKAALTELAAHAKIGLEDIEIVTLVDKGGRRDVDWCSLADEFKDTCSTSERLEDAAASFAHLCAETCTMQTLTLMSELERIKNQHQDFYVLRSTGLYETGVPSGVRVPWISQHLDQEIYDGKALTSELSRYIREDLVAAVTKYASLGKPFAFKMSWAQDRKIVHCVPLIEGKDDQAATTWVCFVRDYRNAWSGDEMMRNYCT